MQTYSTPEPVTQTPELLTPVEVARLSRFTVSSLSQRRHKGLEPAWRKVGGKVLYARVDVERWLEGEQSGTSAA